ncbi:MAG: hypothetical protein ABIF09_16905, partial [Gemmatimonadota bacterium]
SRPVKGRQAQWMESALRAVGVLNFGAIDWVLNSGAHVPIDQVLKQSAILELDALTNSDKTFLIESLLLWIHHHRMNEPGREKLKHVLLIEEAHHVLLKKKQELTGAEAVTDVILREIREFGEAIILLDQLPSLISRPALENTYTTIAMNLKEKGDVTAAAKAMLLETDEARYLGRLPVGWGIIKLQARWVKPFLLRFPLFAIRKGVVTDQQVRDQYQETMKPEEAARLMKATTDGMVRLVQGVVGRGESGPGKKQDHTLGVKDVSEGELEFLEDVHTHPVSAVTKRYSRLGLSPKQGTRLVSRLIDRGFLEAATVPIPGSHVKLLELAAPGRQILNLPEPTDRHGGPDHRFWTETIHRELRQAGLDVRKEAPLGEGKTVDLLVTRDGKRIGIEVETGKSDWKANLRKCLSAGLDQVILAGTRATVCRIIAKSLDDRGEVGVAPAWRAKDIIQDWKRDP